MTAWAMTCRVDIPDGSPWIVAIHPTREAAVAHAADAQDRADELTAAYLEIARTVGRAIPDDPSVLMDVMTDEWVADQRARCRALLEAVDWLNPHDPIDPMVEREDGKPDPHRWAVAYLYDVVPATGDFSTLLPD